jgi:hypothetical protein
MAASSHPKHEEVLPTLGDYPFGQDAKRRLGAWALFRSEPGVATGAAWGRNDGHLAGARGRWRADFGINAGWRTQHPIGLGEFVAQRFVGSAYGVI